MRLLGHSARRSLHRAGAVASHWPTAQHNLDTWTITDDWPEHVPIAQAELDVFEAWFGDLFDEFFGPCR